MFQERLFRGEVHRAKRNKKKLADLEPCTPSKRHSANIPDSDTTCIKSEPLDPDYPEPVPSRVKLKGDMVSDQARGIASVQIVPYPLALFQNFHASKTTDSHKTESSLRNVKRHRSKKKKLQQAIFPQKQKHSAGGGTSTVLSSHRHPHVLPSMKQAPETLVQDQAGLDMSLAENGHFQLIDQIQSYHLAEDSHCQSLDQNQNNCLAEHKSSNQKPVLKMGEQPFVCPVCSERFMDANQLVTHSRTQDHFAKAYHCSLCSSSFDKLGVFQSHVCAIKCKGRQYFQCEFCPQKFKTRADLKQHAAKHNGELSFQCVICSSLRSSDKLLCLHIKRNHSKECLSMAIFAEKNLLYCSICSAAFRYMSALEAHAESHKKDRTVEGNRNDTNMDGQDRHSRKEFGKGGDCRETHENSGCKKENDEESGENRQVHEKGEDCQLHLSHPLGEKGEVDSLHLSHAPVCDGTERPYRCSECPSAFSAKPLQLKHFSCHHMKKPYQCPYCSKDYPTPQGLRDHVKDHIYEGRRLYCYKCDRYFDKFSSLSVHNTKVHRKVLRCPKCTCMFAREHNLKKHLKMHKTWKYFVCPHCPRKFKDHPLLLVHVKNHEEKKYMCCKCSSLHSTPHNLRRHFRSHRGEICFLCPHCPQSFLTLAEVQEHVISHAEKPASSENKSHSSTEHGGLKLVFRRMDQNSFTCSLPAAGKSDVKTDNTSLPHSLEQKEEKMTACDSTEPDFEYNANDGCFDSDTVCSASEYFAKDRESHHLSLSQAVTESESDHLVEATSMDMTDQNIHGDTAVEPTYMDFNPLIITPPSGQLREGRCNYESLSEEDQMAVDAVSLLSGGQNKSRCVESDNSHSQEPSENVDEDTMDYLRETNDDNIDVEVDATSMTSCENTLPDSSSVDIVQESKTGNLGHKNDICDGTWSEVDVKTVADVDTRTPGPGLASDLKTTQPTTAKHPSLKFSHYEKPVPGKPGVVSRVVPETQGTSKMPKQTSDIFNPLILTPPSAQMRRGRCKNKRVRKKQPHHAKPEPKLLHESPSFSSIFSDPNVRSMLSEAFKSSLSVSERKPCPKKVILLVKPVEKSGQNTSGPVSSSGAVVAQSGECFRVHWDPEKRDIVFETLPYPDASAHDGSTKSESQVCGRSSGQCHFPAVPDKGSPSRTESEPVDSCDSVASCTHSSLHGSASLTEGHPDLLHGRVKVEGQPEGMLGNRSSAQGQLDLCQISGFSQPPRDQDFKQGSGQGQDKQLNPTELSTELGGGPRPSTQFGGELSGSQWAKTLLESEAKYNQQTQTTEYTLYKCPWCPNLFRSMSATKVHMRTHRIHRCNRCFLVFKTYAQLMQHFKSRGCKKSHRCSQCSASFTYPSDLRIHQRIHSGEKPYKCAHCPREFKSMSELSSHNKTHSEEKPYTCSECPSSFRRLSDLKVHSRIHSGEKPFLCSECASAFKSIGELKSHAKVHTQEKPFKCSECPSAFKSASDLKVHTRTHTGEKPFLCSQCPWAFKSVGELKSHEKRVHKVSVTTSASLH